MRRTIKVENYLPGPTKQIWNADAEVSVFDKFIKITSVLHDGGYLIIEVERPLIID